MPGRELPAEDRLRALARRFAEGERRVRALVRDAAAGGDRRALLTAALAVLYELRQAAAEAPAHVAHAYAVSAAAVERLTGLPTPDPLRVDDLGRSLWLKLDQALARAETGSRYVFASHIVDIGEGELIAITARIDRRGRRYPLADEAESLTRTIGRHAVVRGTLDPLPPDAMVEISGGDCPICEPLQGEQPAGVAPPFHPKCECVATPIGYSVDEHAAAMRP
jgi:hypothetical protein